MEVMCIIYKSILKNRRLPPPPPPSWNGERRQAFATVSVSRLPIISLIVATREAQKCCEEAL